VAAEETRLWIRFTALAGTKRLDSIYPRTSQRAVAADEMSRSLVRLPECSQERGQTSFYGENDSDDQPDGSAGLSFCCESRAGRHHLPACLAGLHSLRLAVFFELLREMFSSHGAAPVNGPAGLDRRQLSAGNGGDARLFLTRFWSQGRGCGTGAGRGGTLCAHGEWPDAVEERDSWLFARCARRGSEWSRLFVRGDDMRDWTS
jgi:hypothetical protein